MNRTFKNIHIYTRFSFRNEGYHISLILAYIGKIWRKFVATYRPIHFRQYRNTEKHPNNKINTYSINLVIAMNMYQK